jgi:hypothetical protein
MAKLLLRIFLGLTILSVCYSLVHAQTQTDTEALANAEYGSISELLPLNKVFVVSTDLTTRDIITKELKKNPSLELVSRKEDAEFFLAFQISDQLTGASVLGTTATTNRTYYGELIALRSVISDGQRRIRILWHTQKRQAFTGGLSFSRHPAVNATRSFLSALKDAEKQERLVKQQPIQSSGRKSPGLSSDSVPSTAKTASSTAGDLSDRAWGTNRSSTPTGATGADIQIIDGASETRIVTVPMRIFGDNLAGLYITVGAIRSKPSKQKPEFFVLTLYEVPSPKIVVKEPFLWLTIDGQETTFGEGHLTSEERDGVSSAYGFLIPYATLERMVAAGQVELRIDNVVCPLNSDHKKVLTHLLRIIAP